MIKKYIALTLAVLIIQAYTPAHAAEDSATENAKIKKLLDRLKEEFNAALNDKYDKNQNVLHVLFRYLEYTFYDYSAHKPDQEIGIEIGKIAAEKPGLFFEADDDGNIPTDYANTILPGNVYTAIAKHLLPYDYEGLKVKIAPKLLRVILKGLSSSDAKTALQSFVDECNELLWEAIPLGSSFPLFMNKISQKDIYGGEHEIQILIANLSTKLNYERQKIFHLLNHPSQGIYAALENSDLFDSFLRDIKKEALKTIFEEQLLGVFVEAMKSPVYGGATHEQIKELFELVPALKDAAISSGEIFGDFESAFSEEEKERKDRKRDENFYRPFYMKYLKGDKEYYDVFIKYYTELSPSFLNSLYEKENFKAITEHTAARAFLIGWMTDSHSYSYSYPYSYPDYYFHSIFSPENLNALIQADDETFPKAGAPWPKALRAVQILTSASQFLVENPGVLKIHSEESRDVKDIHEKGFNILSGLSPYGLSSRQATPEEFKKILNFLEICVQDHSPKSPETPKTLDERTIFDSIFSHTSENQEMHMRNLLICAFAIKAEIDGKEIKKDIDKIEKINEYFNKFGYIGREEIADRLYEMEDTFGAKGRFVKDRTALERDLEKIREEEEMQRY
jgi:hypothetical protein